MSTVNKEKIKNKLEIFFYVDNFSVASFLM